MGLNPLFKGFVPHLSGPRRLFRCFFVPKFNSPKEEEEKLIDFESNTEEIEILKILE